MFNVVRPEADRGDEHWRVEVKKALVQLSDAMDYNLPSVSRAVSILERLLKRGG